MTNAATIRVAAAQFHAGDDVEANLQTCLRMIRQAAECKPDLIVLPEFANHLSWYENQDHCDRVAVTLDGPWLQAIASEARAVGAFVVVNATVRREQGCTGTSILFSPEGDLLATNDKQVYIGHENDFLLRATEPGPVIDTPIGRIGLYACMDGVIWETPRGLALRGAQILCNSLNSFAPDEGSLHIPVRAAENRVFVVAANKTGPLIPEALMGPVSEATGIPPEFLCGAGDSQIVAPDGTVLAKAGKEEAVIWADINPAEADNKLIADGTDVFASRRPGLYRPIGEDPAGQPEPVYQGKPAMQAAMIQLTARGSQVQQEALERVTEAVASGAELVVLPELFLVEDTATMDVAAAAVLCDELLNNLKVLAGDAVIVTSVVQMQDAEYFHAAVAITRDGVIGAQRQLHANARFPWTALSDELVTVDTPFGRLAMLTGGDELYPELFTLLAMQGAEVVAVSFSVQEPWQLSTGLIERAAENRLNLIAVTQPSAHGSSFGNRLHKDFTVMTPWETRKFDGNLTYPIVTRAPAEAGVTLVELTPANAADKVVSMGTDLVRGRPWFLVEAITGQD